MHLTLFQILEDRYKKFLAIITSQLSVKGWCEYIGDPMLADAIMDRLTASVYKIESKSKSLRKIKEHPAPTG